MVWRCAIDSSHEKDIFLLLLIGCKWEEPEMRTLLPLQKLWVAQTVKEGLTTVYNRGSSANIRSSYSNFILDLRDVNGLIYRDYDGSYFLGNWRVLINKGQGESLVLSDLTPKSSVGNITFTINTVSENQLLVTKTTASVNSSGILINYTLIPQ